MQPKDTHVERVAYLCNFSVDDKSYHYCTYLTLIKMAIQHAMFREGNYLNFQNKGLVFLLFQSRCLEQQQLCFKMPKNH